MKTIRNGLLLVAISFYISVSVSQAQTDRAFIHRKDQPVNQFLKKQVDSITFEDVYLPNPVLRLHSPGGIWTDVFLSSIDSITFTYSDFDTTTMLSLPYDLKVSFRPSYKGATFTWKGEGTEGLYEVEVDSIRYAATDTSLLIDTLDFGTHDWRIRSYSGNAFSLWVNAPSFEHIFVVQEPTNLKVFTTPNSDEARFEWDGDAESYEIRIENSLATTSTSSYQKILGLGKHHWSVRARTGDAFSDWVEGHSFGITDGQTAADGDGNIYHIVLIGNPVKGSQYWLKENIKTTSYNDGSPIPHVPDKTQWSEQTSPAYCWYDNDSAKYAHPFGALYNAYVVSTEKVCPIGFHVPTVEEWKLWYELIWVNEKLSVPETWEYEGYKSIETLLAGSRDNKGVFKGMFGIPGTSPEGYWWKSVPPNAPKQAYTCFLYPYFTWLGDILNAEAKSGYTIRCIKD